MFEHAQLFPGTFQSTDAPIDEDGEDVLLLGAREISARRYRYRDRAALYWIDDHGVVIKRVNAFKQQEFVVQISNYVAPANLMRRRSRAQPCARFERQLTC